MRDTVVADVSAAAFAGAEAIHKSTAKPSKKSIENLTILCFQSWWNEAGANGLEKRYMNVYFNIENRHFQVVLRGLPDVFTISHVAGRDNRPLEAYDLHVGAKVNLLGKTVILKQVFMHFCIA